MPYTSTHLMFRSLDDGELATFRQYAHDHDPPDDASDKWLIYHPVVRAEWRKLDKAPVAAPLTSEELDASRA